MRAEQLEEKKRNSNQQITDGQTWNRSEQSHPYDMGDAIKQTNAVRHPPEGSVATVAALARERRNSTVCGRASLDSSKSPPTHSCTSKERQRDHFPTISCWWGFKAAPGRALRGEETLGSMTSPPSGSGHPLAGAPYCPIEPQETFTFASDLPSPTQQRPKKQTSRCRLLLCHGQAKKKKKDASGNCFFFLDFLFFISRLFASQRTPA